MINIVRTIEAEKRERMSDRRDRRSYRSRAEQNKNSTAHIITSETKNYNVSYVNRITTATMTDGSSGAAGWLAGCSSRLNYYTRNITYKQTYVSEASNQHKPHTTHSSTITA